MERPTRHSKLPAREGPERHPRHRLGLLSRRIAIDLGFDPLGSQSVRDQPLEFENRRKDPECRYQKGADLHFEYGSWESPLQVSAGSWTFPAPPNDDLTGDCGGMAAVGDGSNHFYPTWIAHVSGTNATVTAEWSTPLP